MCTCEFCHMSPVQQIPWSWSYRKLLASIRDRCWEPNLPLEVQEVFLTAGPSLQPPGFTFSSFTLNQQVFCFYLLVTMNCAARSIWMILCGNACFDVLCVYWVMEMPRQCGNSIFHFFRIYQTLPKQMRPFLLSLLIFCLWHGYHSINMTRSISQWLWLAPKWLML